jgi:hypothetical protein
MRIAFVLKCRQQLGAQCAKVGGLFASIQRLQNLPARGDELKAHKSLGIPALESLREATSPGTT